MFISRLHMNYFVICISNSFHDSFTHSWVRMDRFNDLMSCSFNLRATTASAIISVTFAPIIWQPNHSPYFASKITFTKPSLCPAALLFLMLKWKFTYFNFISSFFCCLLRSYPTDAIFWRSICTTRNISIIHRLRCSPAIFSTQVIPSAEATCAKAGPAIHHQWHEYPGIFVCSNRLLEFFLYR